jgi:hypothetical protein
MQHRKLAAAVLMALAAACGGASTPTPIPSDPGNPGDPINTDQGDLGDVRGVEEIGSRGALSALVAAPVFNATTGVLQVPLNSADKLLIVSQSLGGAILLNGKAVTDAAGVPAVASGSTGVLKTLQVTAASNATTVVLDYLNGYFAPGVTGTFTSSTPIGQGTTVDFGAYTGCAFKVRATSNNDTVYFGLDKTASANKLVSYNNGNFGDVWIKGSSTTTTYGVSLGVGDDTFNATPGSSVLGGLLNPFPGTVAVHGGLGNDTITGGLASDAIYGDEGNNLVDESGYLASLVSSATSTRQFTFNAGAHTISVSSTTPGSFLTDLGTPTPPFVVMVGGTLLNGTTAAPKFFTVTAATATLLTVTETVTAEGPIATAVVTLPNTTHAADTVYGLASTNGVWSGSTTTVTYAARTFGRMASATAVPVGVTIKVGHDGAGAFYAGTEDNLDESVAVVIGTDFKDTLWCNNFTDAPCTLVGGKGDDSLKAGMSPTSTHRVYGGDGNDTVIMTDNTDNALLVGGNWTDANFTPVATGSSTRKFTISATSTNPGTISATSTAPGSFLTDGFQVGQVVTVTGSASNNRTFTLTGVAATVLTFSGTSTASEIANASIVITGPTVAPTNTYQDTVDYSALTASAVTIDLNFAYPNAPKGYTTSTPYSGSSARLHTNITKDFSKAICPGQSATQTCTFVGNNRGNFVVAGKGPDSLTGGTGDDTFDLGLADNGVLAPVAKTVNGNGGVNDSVDFSGRTATSTLLDVSCLVAGGCTTNSGTTVLDPGVTVTASVARGLILGATTITATGTAPGSFVLDGFAAGQLITLANAATSTNDGTFTLTAVSDTVLTWTAGTPTSTGTFTGNQTVSRAGPVVASATRMLTFDAATKTITATSTAPGSFTDDGFASGQTIVVTGTASNNGTYTISGAPSATVITVTQALVDEVETSAGTISRRVFEGSKLIGITNASCPAATAGSLSCTVTGNSNSNILDLNNCTGAVLSCGGGSDLVLNASYGVTGAGCGI